MNQFFVFKFSWIFKIHPVFLKHSMISCVVLNIQCFETMEFYQIFECFHVILKLDFLKFVNIIYYMDKVNDIIHKFMLTNKVSRV